MCGIYGWIPGAEGVRGEKISLIVKALSAAMHSRGPDDHGCEYLSQNTWKSEFVDFPILDKVELLLGHNRLSIIDLSMDGHQPMRYLNGRYTVVFNGEIYNYKELRTELQAQGFTFRSQSDTEVLVASFAAWGESCLLRFVGMFAFAIYDIEEKKLFCARDCFGIKPFFYSEKEDAFMFASELPALLEFPGVSKEIDPQSAYDYLRYGFVDTGSATMLKQVKQLPPAHCMTIEMKAGHTMLREVKRYWYIDLKKKSNLGFREAAEKLRQMFLESVKLHLRSDVPLGIALSGGIDSSAVACSVRAIDPQMTIDTFSYIAVDSDEVNEEKWIDLVNEKIGARPHKIYVRPEELVGDIDVLIQRLGEPFVSTSIYAQYRVFKLVAEAGVTVTLDGQGADEMLAGYIGYPAERMESLIRAGKFVKALNFLKATSAWPGREKRTIIISLIRKFSPIWLQNIGRKIIGQDPMPKWLNAAWFKTCKVKRGVNTNKDPIYFSPDKVRVALASALTRQGLSMLLRHGDRNAMSFSIESRVPFLTRELVEFLLSLPEEYLIDQSGRTKSIFREAMRGIVPDEILDRRDKIGFKTPESDWLIKLAPWVRGILAKAKDDKAINAAEAEAQWLEVESGRKPFDGLAWRMINYLRWKNILGATE